ncbi:MAG: L-threonylcarbamoyladenylate synthase [Candidatus Bruticola sp.]
MLTSEDELIKQAAQELNRGGMVAFPTETVYGLGADAANPEAIRKVYALKGRPADHPSIVHLDELDKLQLWAREIPNAARKLAEHFWPGPMTLILPKRPEVLTQVTGGQDSVGLRIPAHPLTRKLISVFGRGLIGPSANRFGHISPTSADHVREEFGSQLRFILDGGPCSVGVESTIIDFSKEQPVIVRPGMLSASVISDIAGIPISCGQGSKAPGTLKKHYAPHSPAKLVTAEQLMQLASQPQGSTVILSRNEYIYPVNNLVRSLRLPNNPEECAQALYNLLRYADSLRPQTILIEQPPQNNERWFALLDRLQRACAN